MGVSFYFRLQGRKKGQILYYFASGCRGERRSALVIFTSGCRGETRGFKNTRNKWLDRTINNNNLKFAFNISKVNVRPPVKHL